MKEFGFRNLGLGFRVQSNQEGYASESGLDIYPTP